ncbi:MAG TPA: tetratricopeptide repeat protein, partial [Sphingomonas sp.]|nr:tetratricopeptide repeat protein [Sphingomonas sp.]
MGSAHDGHDIADPDRSRELTRQANRLRAEGRWEDALPLSFEALRCDPNSPAAAHNLGVLLTKLGRLAEGEAVIRHALALTPDAPLATHALAHNLLAQGRYAEGWPLYAVRSLLPELNTGFPRDFPFPQWRGEPLAGKRLAVFPEQGLGDQIQFARFLPTLIAQAEEVILLAIAPLERLFRHNFPRAKIVRAAGKVEFPDPDYWITLHDLPAALQVRIDDIPGRPYLRPPESGPPLGPGFNVGLKTIGNPRHVNDGARSLPNEIADRLRTGLPGRVISLEPTESGAKDMADTAAIIDQLDLIVSVDTSVAHLAGALGKPCLLLVPGFSPDWRWMTRRTDSPWYPNHSLYRGEVNGDWRPATERLIADAQNIARTLAVRGLVQDAIALHRQGKPLAALAAAETAAASEPDDLDAAHAYGVLLSHNGRLDEGEALLRKVVAARPDRADTRHALGVNLLAQGRYREAWPYHDARIDRTGLDDGYPRDFAYPRWRGEDLTEKRIVIFPDQGFGDQIQFVRFLPALVKRGAKVTLLTPPALFRLFQHNFPDIQLLMADGAVEFPDPDYWAALADLPGMLQIGLEDVSGASYLRAPTKVSVPGDAFKVGL